MEVNNYSFMKVGGSLLGWPALIPALEAQIATVRQPVVLLFGGGVMVDLLRDLDRVYCLGEKTSHWIAIDTLDLIARAMVAAMPSWKLWLEVGAPSGNGVFVVAPATFCRWDARQNPVDCLPESWAATSDSIALRMATVWGFESLTLLKATGGMKAVSDSTSESWDGLVDEEFAKLTKKSGAPRFIRLVSLIPR